MTGENDEINQTYHGLGAYPGGDTPCFAQTGERKLNIDERMIHRRAIEVIAWSQPLMGFKAVRDAFLATGSV